MNYRFFWLREKSEYPNCSPVPGRKWRQFLNLWYKSVVPTHLFCVRARRFCRIGFDYRVCFNTTSIKMHIGITAKTWSNTGNRWTDNYTFAKCKLINYSSYLFISTEIMMFYLDIYPRERICKITFELSYFCIQNY